MNLIVPKSRSDMERMSSSAFPRDDLTFTFSSSKICEVAKILLFMENRIKFIKIHSQYWFNQRLVLLVCKTILFIMCKVCRTYYHCLFILGYLCYCLPNLFCCNVTLIDQNYWKNLEFVRIYFL